MRRLKSEPQLKIKLEQKVEMIVKGLMSYTKVFR